MTGRAKRACVKKTTSVASATSYLDRVTGFAAAGVIDGESFNKQIKTTDMSADERYRSTYCLRSENAACHWSTALPAAYHLPSAPPLFTEAFGLNCRAFFAGTGCGYLYERGARPMTLLPTAACGPWFTYRTLCPARDVCPIAMLPDVMLVSNDIYCRGGPVNNGLLFGRHDREGHFLACGAPAPAPLLYTAPRRL